MKAVKIAKPESAENDQKESVSKSKSAEKNLQKSVKSKKTESSKKKVRKSEGTASEWWNRTRQYLREVIYELRKVVWPSRKETIASTSVVLVVVMIMGIFLGFADVILSRFIRLIIG